MKKTMKSTTIGKKLRKIRRLIDLDQHEVATYLGVTPSAVGHYERGFRMIPITKIELFIELCKKHGLDITCDDLIDDSIIIGLG